MLHPTESNPVPAVCGNPPLTNLLVFVAWVGLQKTKRLPRSHLAQYRHQASVGHNLCRPDLRGPLFRVTSGVPNLFGPVGTFENEINCCWHHTHPAIYFIGEKPNFSRALPWLPGKASVDSCGSTGMVLGIPGSKYMVKMYFAALFILCTGLWVYCVPSLKVLQSGTALVREHSILTNPNMQRYAKYAPH